MLVNAYIPNWVYITQHNVVADYILTKTEIPSIFVLSIRSKIIYYTALFKHLLSGLVDVVVDPHAE